MADHVRKQIRDAVVTALTGLTTTGPRIHDSRIYELRTLPALVVYATDETVEPSDLSGKLDRELTVMIEGYAKAIASVEDTIDLIAKEIEIAMDADLTFGGLALHAILDSTEIDLSGEGEKPLAVINMNYKILYRTAKGSPDVSV